MYRQEKESGLSGFTKGLIITGLTLVLILVAMWGFPIYGVWQQRLAGEAALARASQDRQIANYDAEALVTRARGEADAEIERARGVDQANRIITDGLGGPRGYLEYLYIQALREHEGAVIYVPTEAGLPILEAGRRAEVQNRP